MNLFRQIWPVLCLIFLAAGCGKEQRIERLGELHCEAQQRVGQADLDAYIERVSKIGQHYALVTRIDKDTQEAVSKHLKQNQIFLYLVAPNKEADVLVMAVTNPMGGENYMQQVYRGALEGKELTAICQALKETKNP